MYTISEPVGIHARPAGMLVKKASEFSQDSVSITAHGRTVDAKRLFAVMSLGVQKGETVLVQVEGPTEEETYQEMKKFFQSVL